MAVARQLSTPPGSRHSHTPQYLTQRGEKAASLVADHALQTAAAERSERRRMQMVDARRYSLCMMAGICDQDICDAKLARNIGGGQRRTRARAIPRDGLREFQICRRRSGSHRDGIGFGNGIKARQRERIVGQIDRIGAEQRQRASRRQRSKARRTDLA